MDAVSLISAFCSMDEAGFSSSPALHQGFRSRPVRCARQQHHPLRQNHSFNSDGARHGFKPCAASSSERRDQQDRARDQSLRSRLHACAIYKNLGRMFSRLKQTQDKTLVGTRERITHQLDSLMHAALRMVSLSKHGSLSIRTCGLTCQPSDLAMAHNASARRIPQNSRLALDELEVRTENTDHPQRPQLSSFLTGALSMLRSLEAWSDSHASAGV